jgi:hypothetical protein
MEVDPVETLVTAITALRGAFSQVVETEWPLSVRINAMDA